MLPDWRKRILEEIIYRIGRWENEGGNLSVPDSMKIRQAKSLLAEVAETTVVDLERRRTKEMYSIE